MALYTSILLCSMYSSSNFFVLIFRMGFYAHLLWVLVSHNEQKNVLILLWHAKGICLQSRSLQAGAHNEKERPTCRTNLWPKSLSRKSIYGDRCVNCWVNINDIHNYFVFVVTYVHNHEYEYDRVLVQWYSVHEVWNQLSAL